MSVVHLDHRNPKFMLVSSLVGNFQRVFGVPEFCGCKQVCLWIKFNRIIPDFWGYWGGRRTGRLLRLHRKYFTKV